MNWYKVTEFPASESQVGLHEFLLSQGVQHRFTEEGSRQCLWLVNPAEAIWVERYLQNPAAAVEACNQQAADVDAADSDRLTLMQSVRVFPLTLVTIILGVLGYLSVSYVFVPVQSNPFLFLSMTAMVETGQYWRVLTPAFLHFGVLHVLFNGLWIWEFGRRIEVFTGKIIYSALFLFSAVGANLIQYVMGGGHTLFGGLSGVVYAYMGYLMVWNRYSNHPLIKMPPGIFIFMLVWLALGFFGIIDVFISGSVANGAHLGGLICGIVFAFIQYVLLAHIFNKR